MDLGKAGVIAEGEALESSAPRVGYRVVVVLLRVLLIAGKPGRLSFTAYPSRP